MPAVLYPAGLGPPTVREQIRVAVEHPLKIDAVVNFRRQPDNLFILGKALPHRQNAAKQQCRIDRRQLGFPDALTRMLIDKMIKPAVFGFLAVGKKLERRPRPFPGLITGHPASLRADAVTTERKSRSGNTCHLIMARALGRRCPVGPRPVEREAGFRIGMIPKILKSAPLQIFEKGVVLLAHRGGRGRGLWRRIDEFARIVDGSDWFGREFFDHLKCGLEVVVAARAGIDYKFARLDDRFEIASEKLQFLCGQRKFDPLFLCRF